MYVFVNVNLFLKRLAVFQTKVPTWYLFRKRPFL